ncbi:MAG: NADPH-adrenodoxin reductase [Thelocarpon superellum]|nr:MAG: NADPH-adrenodoxin reductase [Thelocarpon superellum]
MAVIGSGPAGFYTAHKVMSRIPHAIVDMYERLPVPFGLVRFGVAPDHPKVKNCQDKFSEVAASPRFNFFGNVAVGETLSLSTLTPHYDAIVLAYGASEDRRLHVPGEETLRGIYSARAFVGWYNGLPEYADLRPDLEAGDEAVVIGQGNVALDVARTLLTDVDRLRSSDMTTYAVEALSKSRVKRAAFTIKEVRELLDLPSVGFHPIAPSILPQDLSRLPRAAKRITQLLSRGARTPLDAAPKTWELPFFLAPTAFVASPAHPDRLSGVHLEKMRLESADPLDPAAKVQGTGEMVVLPASIAFRSIGYKSEALSGLADLGVPFDERLGIIPNDAYGRVLAPAAGPGPMAARHVPGVYCAGWAKRGPTGVIASTMDDAFATAEVIAADWTADARFLNAEEGRVSTGLGWDGVKDQAQKLGVRPVSWADWQAIDAAERERGKHVGKEREKFTTTGEMLAVLER